MRGRDLVLRALAILPGPRITCNFCGQRFRRIGPDYSEALHCPRCGSVARERVVYEAILERFTSQRGNQVISGNAALRDLRVLEFSPRNNAVRRSTYLRTFKSYVASDFDQSAHVGDIQLDLSDAAAVAALAGSYDVIILCHVLEHIPEYRAAIANLARLVAPNGQVFFQVPFLEALYTQVTWDEFHGDHTRVFHRFGFDIITEFEPHFSEITLYLGARDAEVFSAGVNRAKYGYLPTMSSDCRIIEFGPEKLRENGLGSADLCEVLVLGSARVDA